MGLVLLAPVDLLVRLDGLTKGRRDQFIAIAFATNGKIGNNARLPNIVARAREQGVTVWTFHRKR